jgi:hypothetical protein
MSSFSEIRKRPVYKYLMVLTFAQAASFLGWTALFPNFAVEMAGISGLENGIIQSVREVPGLLSVGVIALLLIMSEATLTSLAILVCGLGVVAAGFFPSFYGLLLTTLTLSFGFHFFEASNQSLTLQHFDLLESPLVISRLRAVTAMGSLFMGLCIVLLAGRLDYRFLFGLAGSFALAGSLWSFTHRPDPTGLPVQKKGLILKKKYWLFYVLTALSGARRLIFQVFVVFLLVEHFGFSLFQMSLLMLINNLLNWLLNPYVGLAINSTGERKLLLCKYSGVFLICMAYVFCDNAFIAAALYVVDQIGFCFNVSIRTFFQKIASPEDIAPSMAVGVAVNHVAAVIVPLIGGFLWMLDRRIPFAMGALFAALSLFFTRLIAIPVRTEDKG